MAELNTTLGWRRSLAAALVACIVLVGLFDWLFYRQPIGWTVGLFFLVLTAAVCLRRDWTNMTRQARATLLAITGLIGALILHPGVLTILAIGAAIVSLAVIHRGRFKVTVSAWLAQGVRFVLIGWVRVFGDLRVFHKWQRSRPSGKTGRYKGLVSWFIAVTLSLVFVGLFAIANPIITNWVEHLGVEIERFFEVVTVPRIMMWGFIGVWSWALLRGRLKQRRYRWVYDQGILQFTANPELIEKASGRSASASWLERWLDPHLVVRCLMAFNAVFLVQTSLDVMYLFGGAELPLHLTYAQYAHRGAYPLIATALLAALFVLMTFRPGSPTLANAWCRRLVYLWLAQNVFLTFSSVWRLGLYVDVYSLSRWRVAAFIWMGLVAAGLGWIAWRIVSERSNAWLIKMNVLTATAVIYACCFINFDRIIANYNVRHCYEITGKGAFLDLEYLDRLGPDSLPALAWYEKRTRAENPITSLTQDGNAPTLNHFVDHDAPILIKQLKHRLQDNLSNWRGWSYRRHRLAKQFLADQKRVGNTPPNLP